MSACTFFGHRDCPSSIKPKLREALIDLIENHTVDMFYVGQQGAFDSMIRSVLKELVSLYPHINYAVVLERMPPKRDEFDTRDYKRIAEMKKKSISHSQRNTTKNRQVIVETHKTQRSLIFGS